MAIGTSIVHGSSGRQASSVRALMAEADALDARDIVWFTHRDYDRLWEYTLGRDDLSLIWRDAGLVDGSGWDREGLAVWRAWMELPRK